ncbi:ABC transporter permease [Furfurilactobacillus entadae]|uniref:ABC transporter permease n=1 Tax=Furfurilactobacillus entadae TaxID=2922307 RepID=UPI0035EBCC76
MYLGWKEMRYERLRFTLLTGVMTLIAVVVFILAGLANGLSQGNRLAVDQWNAQNVYLNETANKTLNASQIPLTATNQTDPKTVAPLSVANTVLRTGSGKKINVAVLATKKKAFIIPSINHGRTLQHSRELLISDNLRQQGIKVGDKLRFGTNATTFTVVGDYQASTYSITPTVYTDLETFSLLTNSPTTMVNAVVMKNNHALTNSKGLQKLPIAEFIQHLPGYTAEQATLNTMIYFLVAMSLAIIGIFMYILTLQKQALFGILKVEGIGTTHILASVIIQAAIISVVGVLIGLLLAGGVGVIAPTGMPFALDYTQLGIYSVLLVVAALLGACCSWRTIARINPVTAIG